MNQPRRPVRDFKCNLCDLIVKGVQQTDGMVTATDRPYSDDVVETCVCYQCFGKIREEEAER